MASENSTETPPGAEAYHGPTAASVDAAEVARFEKMAMDWWDPAGKFRPLHRFNPIRLTHIRDQAARHFGRPPLAPLPLKGLRVLDIGCGGGLLSEPLTRLGARVTGIDAGQQNIEAAKRHADASGLDIDYRHTSAEALRETSARFDLVLNMEVLEHVSDQPGFIDTVAALAAPGGMVVTATLNRTMKSFLFAILGAEYVCAGCPAVPMTGIAS